jgi:hypothetical protein
MGGPQRRQRKKADPARIGLPEEGDDIKFRKLFQEQSKISVPIVIVARKPEKLRYLSKISQKTLKILIKSKSWAKQARHTGPLGSSLFNQ